MDNTEPTIGLLEVTPQGDDAVEQEVLAGLQTADDIDPTLAAAPAGVPARNLVVSQLPKSVDTQMLRQIFGAFGQLVTALVMMDVQNGKSRGFGFVWFERVDDATAAIAAMNGKVLEEGSKPVKVFPSVHPDGLSEAPTIVVLNFPAHLGAAQARPLFEKFGIVKRFQIINDNTARLSLSGSGTQHATAQVLVEFAEVLDARKAVNALHGVRQIQDGPIAVNLALPLVTKYELPGSRPPPRPTPPARPKAGTPSSSYTGGSAMGGSVSTTHGAVQQYAYPLQTNSLPGSGTAHPYSTAPAMANTAAPMHYFVQPPHVMAAPGGGLMYVQPQAFSPPPNAMHSGSTPPQPMFFAPQPNPSPGFVVMQQQPQFAPMPQAFHPQQQPGAPQQMFFVPQANSPMTFAPPPMQASQPPQWMQAPVAQHHPFHPFAPAPPQQPY